MSIAAKVFTTLVIIVVALICISLVRDFIADPGWKWLWMIPSVVLMFCFVVAVIGFLYAPMSVWGRVGLGVLAVSLQFGMIACASMVDRSG